MSFSFIHNRKVQTVLRFIVDFLKNNPIHCTSYLAKTCIHWSELVFWLITILAFLIIGLFNGMDLIKVFNSRNSAITNNLQFTKFETLYPSVTLCPQVILNQTKLDQFVRYNGSLSPQSRILSDFLQQLSKVSVKRSYNFETFKTNIPAKDYMQLIFNLSNYYDVMINNEKAIKIMTEVGICYTINNFFSEQLYTKNWSDINPYPEHPSDHFKRRIRTFNLVNTFPITIVIEHNIIGNIKVYIHSPYEIPTTWTRSTSIINGDNIKSYKLNAFVREINYDKNLLKETTAEIRNCRDKTESNLKLFPSVYSRNLCLMECRAYYILELCGCIPHYYSNAYWRDNKVCNVQGLICFSKHLDIFRKINANPRSSIFKCSHCLPNCIDQIVVVKILKEESISSNSSNIIQCNIDHPSLQSFVRSAMYTYLDFIVLLSGVLSSYLGFCVYSLCDLIYFFTVRIYWFRKGFRGTVDELFFNFNI